MKRTLEFREINNIEKSNKDLLLSDIPDDIWASTITFFITPIELFRLGITSKYYRDKIFQQGGYWLKNKKLSIAFLRKGFRCTLCDENFMSREFLTHHDKTSCTLENDNTIVLTDKYEYRVEIKSISKINYFINKDKINLQFSEKFYLPPDLETSVPYKFCSVILKDYMKKTFDPCIPKKLIKKRQLDEKKEILIPDSHRCSTYIIKTLNRNYLLFWESQYNNNNNNNNVIEKFLEGSEYTINKCIRCNIDNSLCFKKCINCSSHICLRCSININKKINCHYKSSIESYLLYEKCDLCKKQLCPNCIKESSKGEKELCIECFDKHIITDTKSESELYCIYSICNNYEDKI